MPELVTSPSVRMGVRQDHLITSVRRYIMKLIKLNLHLSCQFRTGKMVRGLILPNFKCKKGSNTCPFCRIRKPTARSLIDHCLEEILDNVHYMCIRCGVSYRYSSRKKMRSNSHICWTMNCAFKVARQYYTVDGIKGLLAPQGIRASLVDKAVERQNFVVPGPHEVVVDSAAEKKLNEQSQPPFNSRVRRHR